MGLGRRIFKESETILAMTSISPKCDGTRGLLIKEQIESLVNKEEECCIKFARYKKMALKFSKIDLLTTHKIVY